MVLFKIMPTDKWPALRDLPAAPDLKNFPCDGEFGYEAELSISDLVTAREYEERKTILEAQAGRHKSQFVEYAVDPGQLSLLVELCPAFRDFGLVKEARKARIRIYKADHGEQRKCVLTFKGKQLCKEDNLKGSFKASCRSEFDIELSDESIVRMTGSKLKSVQDFLTLLAGKNMIVGVIERNRYDCQRLLPSLNIDDLAIPVSGLHVDLFNPAGLKTPMRKIDVEVAPDVLATVMDGRKKVARQLISAKLMPPPDRDSKEALGRDNLNALPEGHPWLNPAGVLSSY